MNIFFTSKDPVKAAKNLANKHKSRMPLESCGMLAFAFPEGEASYKNERTNRHYNHPSSIWARESKENFEWLLVHAIAQCEDYSLFYKREHDSQKHIEWMVDNSRYLTFEKNSLTPFARCFSSFKTLLDETEPDTVRAYRRFYHLDKKDFAKWPSIKHIPEWWYDRSAKYVDKSFKNGEYTKR